MIKESKVLEHGIIALLDVMGDDKAICDAARKSYGEGTKPVSADRDLIRYMMRHGHLSPFEMAELKFYVKCPIFVWRQWIRTRTASVNELSLRYSLSECEFERLSPIDMKYQSTTNKQGGGDNIYPSLTAKILAHEGDCFLDFAKSTYEARIKQKLSREQARTILPVCTYTEAYWKIDLRNLLNFLKLRMDSHAQREIRLYAQEMASFVKELFPLTWEAFEDYHLDSVTLSRLDIEALRKLNLLKEEDLSSNKLLDNIFSNKREKREFIEKINKMHLVNGANEI